VREASFSFGGRTFALRYAPLEGNAVLTERTIPAPLVLGTGFAISLLLGALLWLLAQVGALYREVGRLARTDALTGVANRRAWDDELPMELARAARSGQPLCVALLDRYGGEEFAVLLPDCGLAAAMEIAERLRTAQPEGTCSIGVAAWDGQEEATGLVARADRALYAAKEAGRDRCLAGQAPAVADAAPGR
jgi:diguanylate cyclase